LKQSIPLFSQDKKSFAFLFDMNVLFEKFIARIVKESFDDVEVPKDYVSFGALNLKPDIIVKSTNIIIDCKYKILDENSISSRDDRYQMYVYANNFENIKTTMLLYPKHLDVIDRTIILGENDKKVELKMKTIDLNFSGNFEEYIDEIIKRVEKVNG
jgi:5-methylcytosine-specific restriction enzyme subunit McrC